MLFGGVLLYVVGSQVVIFEWVYCCMFKPLCCWWFTSTVTVKAHRNRLTQLW